MMLALLASAHAGGLDLLEVGGAYGTPGATNPTAIWWNPAGLAADGGTQVMIEGAPVFGRVIGDRANPDYGEIQPFVGSENYPSEYDYSGQDKASLSGVVPFAGVKTNFLVPGLGFGLGLAAPIARGGQSDQEWGANRYALRGGDIRAVHLMAGGAYQIANKIAFGASLSYVLTSYYADVDTTLYPDLEDQITAQFGGTRPAQYQDGFIEQQGYTTTAIFGGQDGDDHGSLHGNAITFGAGVYLTPIGKKLGISLAYNHGYKAFNEGDLTLNFQCPPDNDIIAQLGAQQAGLCNASMNGKGTIAYRLPSRLHAGVVLSPIDRVRLEVMGGLVFWKVFQDYEIGTNIDASEVDIEDAERAEETADLITQDRLWARDAQNTGWVGVDAKMKFNTLLSGGARVIYDRHAIPTDSLSLNNHDADAIIPGVMLQLNPINQLAIGLSYSRQFLMSRTVTNSRYGVTIEEETRKEDRYFYPSANGTYKGSVDRIGLTVRAQFGGPTW